MDVRVLFLLSIQHLRSGSALGETAQHAASAITLMDDTDSFISKLCQLVDILTGDLNG